MLYPAYEGEINVNPDAVRKGSFKSGRNEEAQRRKSPVCSQSGLASGGWSARLCFRIQAIKKLPGGSFLKLNGKVVTSD